MYVALLRGINVGGRNLVQMKELAALFESEGCRDVRTFIQSGNVIFNADSRVLAGLESRMSERITARFRCKAPVLLRNTSDFREIISHNPFLGFDAPEAMLHVYFLADEPKEHLVLQLDRERSLPDVFHVRGKEIYVHLPRGMAYTKLTNAYFDLMLRTVSSSRNWSTVLKLAELAGA